MTVGAGRWRRGRTSWQGVLLTWRHRWLLGCGCVYVLILRCTCLPRKRAHPCTRSRPHTNIFNFKQVMCQVLPFVWSDASHSQHLYCNSCQAGVTFLRQRLHVQPRAVECSPGIDAGPRGHRTGQTAPPRLLCYFIINMSREITSTRTRKGCYRRFFLVKKKFRLFFWWWTTSTYFKGFGASGDVTIAECEVERAWRQLSSQHLHPLLPSFPRLGDECVCVWWSWWGWVRSAGVPTDEIVGSYLLGRGKLIPGFSSPFLPSTPYPTSP